MEEILQFMETHTMYQALVQGDTEEGELPCGQNAGIIKSITSAAEVVEDMVAEIPLVLEGLTRKMPAG